MTSLSEFLEELAHNEHLDAACKEGLAYLPAPTEEGFAEEVSVGSVACFIPFADIAYDLCKGRFGHLVNFLEELVALAGDALELLQGEDDENEVEEQEDEEDEEDEEEEEEDGGEADGEEDDEEDGDDGEEETEDDGESGDGDDSADAPGEFELEDDEEDAETPEALEDADRETDTFQLEPDEEDAITVSMPDNDYEGDETGAASDSFELEYDDYADGG